MANHPLLKRFLLGVLCSVVIVLVLAGFTVKGLPLNAEIFTVMTTAETLELNFSETDTVYYEFDNNAPGPFNFGEVELSQPLDSKAWLVVEFLLDEDGDDIYESTMEGRGYTLDFRPGTSSLTSLPYGSRLKNYCLRITNTSAAVDAATLTMSTRW